MEIKSFAYRLPKTQNNPNPAGICSWDSRSIVQHIDEKLGRGAVWILGVGYGQLFSI